MSAFSPVASLSTLARRRRNRQASTTTESPKSPLSHQYPNNASSRQNFPPNSPTGNSLESPVLAPLITTSLLQNNEKPLSGGENSVIRTTTARDGSSYREQEQQEENSPSPTPTPLSPQASLSNTHNNEKESSSPHNDSPLQQNNTSPATDSHSITELQQLQNLTHLENEPLDEDSEEDEPPLLEEKDTLTSSLESGATVTTSNHNNNNNRSSSKTNIVINTNLPVPLTDYSTSESIIFQRYGLKKSCFLRIVQERRQQRGQRGSITDLPLLQYDQKRLDEGSFHDYLDQLELHIPLFARLSRVITRENVFRFYLRIEALKKHGRLETQHQHEEEQQPSHQSHSPNEQDDQQLFDLKILQNMIPEMVPNNQDTKITLENGRLEVYLWTRRLLMDWIYRDATEEDEWHAKRHHSWYHQTVSLLDDDTWREYYNKFFVLFRECDKKMLHEIQHSCRNLRKWTEERFICPKNVFFDAEECSNAHEYKDQQPRSRVLYMLYIPFNNLILLGGSDQPEDYEKWTSQYLGDHELSIKVLFVHRLKNTSIDLKRAVSCIRELFKDYCIVKDSNYLFATEKVHSLMEVKLGLRIHALENNLLGSNITPSSPTNSHPSKKAPRNIDIARGGLASSPLSPSSRKHSGAPPHSPSVSKRTPVTPQFSLTGSSSAVGSLPWGQFRRLKKRDAPESNMEQETNEHEPETILSEPKGEDEVASVNLLDEEEPNPLKSMPSFDDIPIKNISNLVNDEEEKQDSSLIDSHNGNVLTEPSPNTTETQSGSTLHKSIEPATKEESPDDLSIEELSNPPDTQNASGTTVKPASFNSQKSHNRSSPSLHRINPKSRLTPPTKRASSSVDLLRETTAVALRVSRLSPPNGHKQQSGLQRSPAKKQSNLTVSQLSASASPSKKHLLPDPEACFLDDDDEDTQLVLGGHPSMPKSRLYGALSPRYPAPSPRPHSATIGSNHGSPFSSRQIAALPENRRILLEINSLREHLYYIEQQLSPSSPSSSSLHQSDTQTSELHLLREQLHNLQDTVSKYSKILKKQRLMIESKDEKIKQLKMRVMEQQSQIVELEMAASSSQQSTHE